MNMAPWVVCTSSVLQRFPFQLKHHIFLIAVSYKHAKVTPDRAHGVNNRTCLYLKELTVVCKKSQTVRRNKNFNKRTQLQIKVLTPFKYFIDAFLYLVAPPPPNTHTHKHTHARTFAQTHTLYHSRYFLSRVWFRYMQGTVLLPIYLYMFVSVIYNQIIESG